MTTTPLFTNEELKIIYTQELRTWQAARELNESRVRVFTRIKNDIKRKESEEELLRIDSIIHEWEKELAALDTPPHEPPKKGE